MCKPHVKLYLFVLYPYGVTKAINALFADIIKGEDVTRGKDFCENHMLSYIFLFFIAMVSQRPLAPFLRTLTRERI